MEGACLSQSNHRYQRPREKPSAFEPDTEQSMAASTPSTLQAAHGAQWHPDPSGRFQFRYWDGQAWTSQVATNGFSTVDTEPGVRAPSNSYRATASTRSTPTTPPDHRDWRRRRSCCRRRHRKGEHQQQREQEPGFLLTGRRQFQHTQRGVPVGTFGPQASLATLYRRWTVHRVCGREGWTRGCRPGPGDRPNRMA